MLNLIIFMKLSSHIKRKAGFSLVEIMIAMAIVADLAIIAIPAYDRARKTAQNGRFAADLQTISAAFQIYNVETQKYPPEAGVGIIPTGMDVYLRGVDWTRKNSLGGEWDWDFNQGYARAAINTVQPMDANTIQMVELDNKIDNGVLATGQFRERDPRRFAMILE
jgi:prepilin-type N-terminal cleavage/methylation domain-containing protein